MRGHGSFGLKKLLYKFYELREAVRGLRVAKITRFGPPNAFSTAFGLVFEVLAARKCKGVFATYEAEMNHARNSMYNLTSFWCSGRKLW